MGSGESLIFKQVIPSEIVLHEGLGIMFGTLCKTDLDDVVADLCTQVLKDGLLHTQLLGHKGSNGNHSQATIVQSAEQDEVSVLADHNRRMDDCTMLRLMAHQA